MTRQKKSAVSFKDFLTKFPTIELPITLGNDTHHTFSKNNLPLSQLFIEEFITLLEGTVVDEFTEFIPCFSIPDTLEFHAIVYWKAGLMDYQYILATFTKQGQPIAKKVIGGTFSDGRMIAQSVSTIDSDWTIHVVTGHASLEETYDAGSSTALEIDLLPSGHIVDVQE